MTKKIFTSFEQIPAWMDAHSLVLDIYKTTTTFPRAELFGLTSQLKRATISIPANIAEGFGTNTKKQMVRYLVISRGSCEEVKYYIILAKDLGLISIKHFDQLSCQAKNISKQLYNWIKSLDSKAFSK